MDLVEITYDSPDYHAALELRNDVLRRPLGLDLYAEDLTVERDEWHFGFKDGSQLIATVTLRPEGPTRARLRQMAVAPSHQGQGLGRSLIEQVEPIARTRGIAEIHLHARGEAEGFYTRLGYTRVGEEFVEIGVRHVEMRKLMGGD